MSEQYGSREDREAARTLASNIDSDAFRLSFAAGRRGREGRQAQQAIVGLRGQQVELLNGTANRTAGQIDRRQQGDNTLAGMQVQQQGELQRTLIGDATAREGQQLAHTRGMAGIDAEVNRPTLQTDADGNLISVAGTSARSVTGADGARVRVPRPQAGQITPSETLKFLGDQRAALLQASTLADEKQSEQITAQLGQLDAQIQQLIAPPQASSADVVVNKQTGERKRWNQQSNSWETIK